MSCSRVIICATFQFCLSILPIASFGFGDAAMPSLDLESTAAGATPAHHLGFSIAAGEPEVYYARIRFPREFGFNGFYALGPPETPVGAITFELNGDDMPEFAHVVRSLSRLDAYVDVMPDGVFSTDLEPYLRVRGRVVELLLPSGGDFDPQTILAPVTADVVLTLFAGLMRNPDVVGIYEIAAELISVDPDTGDFDDGENNAPETLEVSLAVDISGPGGAQEFPFADFVIHRADVVRNGSGKDRVMIEGSYSLASASDGIQLPLEDVLVAFGPFEQLVAGASFKPTDEGHLYKSKGSGIKSIKLFPDGGFQIDVRDLNLDEVDLLQPVAFAFRIGNDLGSVDISFDANGHYRP